MRSSRKQQNQIIKPLAEADHEEAYAEDDMSEIIDDDELLMTTVRDQEIEETKQLQISMASREPRTLH